MLPANHPKGACHPREFIQGSSSKGVHPREFIKGVHQGSSSKGVHQGSSSKGVHPREFIQGSSSKGVHPREFIQGSSSKGLIQGSSSKGVHPREFIQGSSSKGVHPREFIQGSNVMNRVTTLTLSAVLLPLLGLVLPSNEAVAQQAGPTLHRYLVRAVLSTEGLKNLQKQPPTALKAGVAKFVEFGRRQARILVLRLRRVYRLLSYRLSRRSRGSNRAVEHQYGRIRARNYQTAVDR